jgi:ABC-2 type transport system ATP-binding protein
MNANVAIHVSQLSYSYGSHTALADVSFDVRRGEVFAFLGPNGGGKTTLFRILSTLIPPQTGDVQLMGCHLPQETWSARASIGVVFQSSSLDKKLTVEENLRHQAALYGLSSTQRQQREAELLQQLGLSERRRERAETLSGGLRRRVELAKGMIHQPRLLLMDEPSSGLDPGARSDLWQYLLRLRDQFGVTVVLTTHLLDEAEKADRLAILHRGSLVALDTPDALRSSVGGESITIETDEPEELATAIGEQFHCPVNVVDGDVRLEQPDGHRWIARLVEAFPGRIAAIRLGKPTLEDVFIDRTGHRMSREHGEAAVG